MKWAEMTARQKVFLAGWIVTTSKIVTLYVEREEGYEFVTAWFTGDAMIHVKVEARRGEWLRW